MDTVCGITARTAMAAAEKVRTRDGDKACWELGLGSWEKVVVRRESRWIGGGRSREEGMALLLGPERLTATTEERGGISRGRGV